MISVNVYELKTNLSKYIEMLESGKEETIVVCRYDKKVAQITLYRKDEKKPRLGCGIGLLEPQKFELKKGFEDIAQTFGY